MKTRTKDLRKFLIMTFQIDADRAHPMAEVAALIAALLGVERGVLEAVSDSVNPWAKIVRRLRAREKVDGVSARLALDRPPMGLERVVPFDVLEDAASESPIPDGHMAYLGCSEAWACNCRADTDGLWCGILLVYAAVDSIELKEWATGRVFRVKVPRGVVGGLKVKLAWCDASPR